MPPLSERLRRERLNLILAAVLAGLSLNVFYARHGLRDLLVLRSHGVQLEGQRGRLAEHHAVLEGQIKRLQSDDVYLQRLIRKELEYARPGELIYRFPAEPPATN